MELDFLSPRAKEISQKKTNLIVCLREQNIQSSDLINDHVWFMKKLSSDHPLKEVIKECQNTVREGFLTPLTERSSVSVEITAGMFVEEILDNIKMKHLKILQLDELIQRLTDNMNTIQTIDIKSMSRETEQILEICLLQQPNDNYSLFLNIEKLELNHWYTQPLNLFSQQQYSLYYLDQHIETISVNMIYQIANNPQNIKNTEYQQLLYLTFLENENLQLSYELQQLFYIFRISMKFNLTNDIKKKMLASLKQEINEIDDKVNQEIKLITQLLEPFSGHRYLRGVGICDKAAQSKARNQCCNIF